MQVNLYKRNVEYTNQDGEVKTATNYFVQCGDVLVPVEVKYFPNPKLDNRDPGYSARFAVLRAFATPLPEKEKKEEKVTSMPTAPAPEGAMEELGDDKIPF